MAQVRFTSALNRFFPTLQACTIRGNTVIEVIKSLDKYYPGLITYILDDQLCLRKHVNIFIDGHIMMDRLNLEQEVSGDAGTLRWLKK